MLIQTARYSSGFPWVKKQKYNDIVIRLHAHLRGKYNV